MSDGEISPVELARTNEALRQERETFDQRKVQDHRWFTLRLVMGYVSIPFLISLAVYCGYILLNWQVFSERVVTGAAVVLFTDVVGLIIGVWKIVFNPKSVSRLQPVTTIGAPATDPNTLPDKSTKTRTSRKLPRGTDSASAIEETGDR